MKNYLTAKKDVKMFDSGELALVKGKLYEQVPFESLSGENKKRLIGCIGVIDERGKEHWFEPNAFTRISFKNRRKFFE